MMNHPLPSFLRKRAKGHRLKKKNTHLKMYHRKRKISIWEMPVKMDNFHLHKKISKIPSKGQN